MTGTAGRQGFTHFKFGNFAADLVEKVTPSDPVLLNYILQREKTT